jgi:aryl-alcohol dehydrogenase (NADP+)
LAQNTTITRIDLGSPDLKIHPFGLGGNTFGTRTDQEASERILDVFVANGGNLIDTADMYSYWVPGAAGGRKRSSGTGSQHEATGTTSPS